MRNERSRLDIIENVKEKILLFYPSLVNCQVISFLTNYLIDEIFASFTIKYLFWMLIDSEKHWLEFFFACSGLNSILISFQKRDKLEKEGK